MALPVVTHVVPGGRAIWRRWFIGTTIGETLGFCVPALLAPLVGTMPALIMMAVLVPAGVVEGALLGLGQAYALRQVVPAVSTARWVAATAAAAGFAWFLGLLPSTVGQALWTASPAATLILGVLCALLLLASIGFSQWCVLRRHVPSSSSWIATTAVAWCVGLVAFLSVATPLWHEGQSAATTVLVGVLGATLMAATVAAITGLALRRLLTMRDARPTYQLRRGLRR